MVQIIVQDKKWLCRLYSHLFSIAERCYRIAESLSLSQKRHHICHHPRFYHPIHNPPTSGPSTVTPSLVHALSDTTCSAEPWFGVILHVDWAITDSKLTSWIILQIHVDSKSGRRKCGFPSPWHTGASREETVTSLKEDYKDAIHFYFWNGRNRLLCLQLGDTPSSVYGSDCVDG